MPWVPQKLYDAINLPQLVVKFRRDDGTADEEAEDDVRSPSGSALSTTRRYGDRLAHWLVPPNPGPTPATARGSPRTRPDQDLLSNRRVLDAGSADAGIDARIREGLPADTLDRPAHGHLPLDMVRPTRNRRLAQLQMASWTQGMAGGSGLGAGGPRTEGDPGRTARGCGGAPPRRSPQRLPDPACEPGDVRHPPHRRPACHDAVGSSPVVPRWRRQRA